MVADERPHKNLTGIDRLIPDFDADIAVGILQVTVDRAGTEVDPFAHVRMPEDPMVLFVGVSVKNRPFEFAADLAIGADAGGLADDGCRLDERVSTDVAWTLQYCVG